MIQRLLIKNYAIIEELEINFSKGLTIITGETGAGKSILLGALGLIMGKRADTKSLYNENTKCIVEGHFDIEKYKLKAFFDTHDIDFDNELVVRREITPSGKTRSFVNDTPVNLKILNQLSNALIDLHQQFDTLDIHNVSFQLRMMDALADNTSLLERYQKLYKQYQADKRRLQQLIEQNANSGREIDFIQFQLEEFNKVALVPDEQEKLEKEQATLTNSEDIKRILSASFRALSEDDQSVINQLNTLSSSLSDVRDLHPNLQSLAERLDSTIFELQDIANECEGIADQTEHDGNRIIEIQERLDSIYRLQRKHNAKDVDALIVILNGLQEKLDSFSDLSADIENLENAINQHEVKLKTIAKDLSKRRHGVTKGFESKIHKMLRQLSMEHAQLEVKIVELEQLNSTGMDEVNFLFAANKGGRMMPIKDVASGGELSRLTLCSKSLVASAIPLPTLIFDEIDTGISGDVALKMGDILRQLSNQHQVVSITHSPQIASKADTHYFVYKKIKENRTATGVRKLTQDERVRAIATMLSSNPPTESAMENARDLLKIQQAT